jgi:hypothetical protein
MSTDHSQIMYQKNACQCECNQLILLKCFFTDKFFQAGKAAQSDTVYRPETRKRAEGEAKEGLSDTGLLRGGLFRYFGCGGQ